MQGRRHPPDVRATRSAGGAAVGVLHVSPWRPCAAQGGPRAAARAVCGQTGVSRGENACHTRALRACLRGATLFWRCELANELTKSSQMSSQMSSQLTSKVQKDSGAHLHEQAPLAPTAQRNAHLVIAGARIARISCVGTPTKKCHSWRGLNREPTGIIKPHTDL